MNRRVVIIGGAGYIGSVITASFLSQGHHVSVIDDLLFGGESLLSFIGHPGFVFHKENIVESRFLDQAMDGADTVVHLAALVGFPACDRAGREATWSVNVEGTHKVYEAARRSNVRRLIYASSYSNYGFSKDDLAVTEESPLFPQSLYAESKVAAERFLLDQASEGSVIITCLRLATVFGLSPRTRFDLMVNQFVLDAFAKRKLVVYQTDFKRSFVHVRDVANAVKQVMAMSDADIRGQVFNIGSEKLNTTKTALVRVIREKWPDVEVEYRNADFGGDMRSLHVSFEKAHRILGFKTSVSLEEGIEELCQALEQKLITEPFAERYRNHPPILV